jgi:heme/copper-type cytochrome/quinol oxidase subunit 2
MERRNSRSSVTTREFKQMMKWLGVLVFVICIFVIFMIFYYFIDYNSEMPDKKKNNVEESNFQFKSM